MPDDPIADAAGTSPPPLPLNYGVPTSPPASTVLLKTFLALLGIGVGVALTIVLGFFVYDAAHYNFEGSNSASPLGMGIFWTLVAVAIAGVVYSLRRPRKWWFLAGLGLGVAMMGLIEGLCFSTGG